MQREKLRRNKKKKGTTESPRQSRKKAKTANERMTNEENEEPNIQIPNTEIATELPQVEEAGGLQVEEYAGSSVHGYQIEKLIGRGTFAAVYRCRRIIDDKVFAIKVQANEVHKRVNLKARHEEFIMKRVGKHENIVFMEESFTKNYKHFLVLEHVSNGELFDKIVRQSPFTEQMARQYVLDIFTALQYIHSRGIVHRDVKPENLLLTDDGRVKLADFGEASVLKRKGYVEGIAGSKCYIAPEILHGNKPRYDEKVDCWSAGVVTYTMLSGSTPFHSPTRSDIGTLRRIRKGDYDFSASVWKKISGRAKDFIRCTVCKDVRRRYNAREALSHPWLQGTSKAEEGPPAKDIQEARVGLERLKREHQLWKRVDGVIAAALIHRNRGIWENELHLAQSASDAPAKPGTPPADARSNTLQLLRANTKMSEQEWKEWLRRCKSIFRVCDEDGSGKLSLADVLQVSKLFHLGWDNQLVSELFQGADVNNDGLLDFDEFVALIQNHEGSLLGAKAPTSAGEAQEGQVLLQQQQANLQVALLMLFPSQARICSTRSTSSASSGESGQWSDSPGWGDVAGLGITRGSDNGAGFTRASTCRIPRPSPDGSARTLVSKPELVVLLKQLLPCGDHDLIVPLLDYVMERCENPEPGLVDVTQLLEELMDKSLHGQSAFSAQDFSSHSAEAQSLSKEPSDSPVATELRRAVSAKEMTTTGAHTGTSVEGTRPAHRPPGDNFFSMHTVNLSVDQLYEFWDKLSNILRGQCSCEDSSHPHCDSSTRVGLRERFTPKQFEEAALGTLGKAISRRAHQICGLLLEDLVCNGPWTLPTVQSILFYLIQFVPPSALLVKFCFQVADTDSSGYLDLHQYSAFVTSMVFDAFSGRALELKSSPMLLRELLTRLFESASACNNRISFQDFVRFLRVDRDELSETLFGVSPTELLVDL